MTLDILKCKNGWVINRRYLNRDEMEHWVFKTLEELAQWIIAHPDLTTEST